MKTELIYELHNAGWASLKIHDGHKEFHYAVSYLYDSLCELSVATVNLLKHRESGSVIFMDEPGELKLEIEKLNAGQVRLTGKWYADWASWGMFPKDRFRIDFSFDMGLNDFAADVLLHLESIYITDGVDGYLEKWCEHEFPLKNYLRLKKLLNEHTNTR